MPYRTRAAEILNEWRTVERQLQASPGPDLRLELQLELTRLRRAYQAVFDEARAAAMPEPPPFPADDESDPA